MSNSWIDHGVHQIHDEKDEHRDRSEQKHVEEDDGVVSVGDGLGHEIADARLREYDLNDDNGAEQVGE